MSALPSSAVLSGLRIVLVRTRNPLNIGASARAMSNFGFAHLRLVKPYDVAFREARSAVGASSILAHAEEFDSLGDAVADCSVVVGTTGARGRLVKHPMHRLEAGAAMIRNQLRSGKVAILFGSEKTGLSNSDLSHCQWLARIPTRAQHGSMNLGQAVAVCLYELIRQDAISSQDGGPKYATAAQLERLTAVLLESAQLSGHLPANSGGPSQEKIRRLIHRLNMPASDVDVWLGILRQSLWKMKN
jgi:TrmH family RNA methyltransferase